MARWLRKSARHVGPAMIEGMLYQVADYPGLVPGREGSVRGDLFALDDAAAVLAVLDDYEECTALHPRPHEYRREKRVIQTVDGPLEAWVYIYAYNVSGFSHIAGGDFISCTTAGSS